jgi:hypothetical protein
VRRGWRRWPDGCGSRVRYRLRHSAHPPTGWTYSGLVLSSIRVGPRGAQASSDHRNLSPLQNNSTESTTKRVVVRVSRCADDADDNNACVAHRTGVPLCSPHRAYVQRGSAGDAHPRAELPTCLSSTTATTGSSRGRARRSLLRGNARRPSPAAAQSSARSCACARAAPPLRRAAVAAGALATRPLHPTRPSPASVLSAHGATT